MSLILKYVSGALGVGVLVLLLLLAAEKRHSGKLERRNAELVELRAADRARYEAAAREAEAQNLARLAKIKSQQEAITDEVTDDLSARLELIRRELRAKAPANPGGPGGTEAGGTSEAPCRAVDPAWMCLSPEDRLSAAESEERHDQLITWTERQSEVDTNK